MKIYVASQFGDSPVYNGYYFRKEDAIKYFEDEEKEIKYLMSLSETELDDFLADVYCGMIFQTEVE